MKDAAAAEATLEEKAVEAEAQDKAGRASTLTLHGNALAFFSIPTNSVLGCGRGFRLRLSLGAYLWLWAGSSPFRSTKAVLNPNPYNNYSDRDAGPDLITRL